MKLPTQISVLSTKPEPEKITDVADDLFWKPRGGLWTSTLDDDRGDWVRWMEDQGYTLETPRWGGDLWLLEPVDANVLVLATPDDYNKLGKRFPHPRGSELSSLLRSFDPAIYWPDVAKKYDAVHIPDPRPYRLLLEEEYYSASMFFNVVDAESTCWFKWCFEGEPKLMTKALKEALHV